MSTWPSPSLGSPWWWQCWSAWWWSGGGPADTPNTRWGSTSVRSLGRALDSFESSLCTYSASFQHKHNNFTRGFYAKNQIPLLNFRFPLLKVLSAEEYFTHLIFISFWHFTFPPAASLSRFKLQRLEIPRRWVLGWLSPQSNFATCYTVIGTWPPALKALLFPLHLLGNDIVLPSQQCAFYFSFTDSFAPI